MGSEIAAADDGELAYVLVAEDIEARIRSGELAPGARLRSERDLAGFYGRSYGTIRKAVALLRQRGLVATVHGRGNYVTGTAQAPPPGQDDGA
jgi:GntR family transcriptional regulator